MRAFDVLVFPAAVTVMGCGLLWGGHASYVALRNRAPLEITCADFARARPAAAWVRLTGCKPDVERFGTETERIRRGLEPDAVEITTVFTALRPDGESVGRQARILVEDHSRPAIELIAQPQSDALDLAWRQMYDSVEGMVLDWTQLSARRRSELSSMGLRLAEGFAVVKSGASPSPLWQALGALGAGLGALGYLRMRYRRWKRRQPVAPPKATVVR